MIKVLNSLYFGVTTSLFGMLAYVAFTQVENAETVAYSCVTLSVSSLVVYLCNMSGGKK